MKKISLLFLILIELVLCVIAPGCKGNTQDNADDQPSGILSYGEFKCAENSDGSLTIVGWAGKDPNVVIPREADGKPVSAIGADAFKESSLTSVTIPAGVRIIGDRAFALCNKLETVNLSEGLISIGESAFSVSAVISVVLPGTLRSIGQNAFALCGNLRSINIPGSLTEWGNGAFAFSGVESVRFEDGLTSVGSAAFSMSKINAVILPDSVIEIGESAFYYCKDLESVDPGKNLRKIGKDAFCHCTSLCEITLPDSVEHVDHFAFDFCQSLRAIRFEGDAPEYFSTVPYHEFSFTVHIREGAHGFTGEQWDRFPTEID